jgi:ABC-type amino acid transport substrate-binding protein
MRLTYDFHIGVGEMIKKLFLVFFGVLFFIGLGIADTVTDVNKDNKVGIEEAFSALQVASGLRSETVILDPIKSTLENVKAKGFIQVGVNGNLLGFSKTDGKGIWRGLDVECARAVSAAIFSDPDKLKLHSVDSPKPFHSTSVKRD